MNVTISHRTFFFTKISSLMFIILSLPISKHLSYIINSKSFRFFSLLIHHTILFFSKKKKNFLKNHKIKICCHKIHFSLFPFCLGLKIECHKYFALVLNMQKIHKIRKIVLGKSKQTKETKKSTKLFVFFLF